MKTNFEKLAWAAVAVLLSCVGQSARAIKVTNCTDDDIDVTTYNATDNTRTDAYQSKTISPGGVATMTCKFQPCQAMVDYTYTNKVNALYVQSGNWQEGTVCPADIFQGNALSCTTPPSVRLYTRSPTGGPSVLFQNFDASNLTTIRKANGTSLGDWAGSLEVTSGTWALFKHANYEGRHIFVSAPQTIDHLGTDPGPYVQNSSMLYREISSLKPIDCDARPLGRASKLGFVGYIYGRGDPLCLQKAEVNAFPAAGQGINIEMHGSCNDDKQDNRAWHWDAYYGYIRNPMHPSYCLILDGPWEAGANIAFYRCAHGPIENRQWNYNDSTGQITPRAAQGKGFCIDHSGNNDGANIHLWSCSPNDGNSNNQWKITWGDSGN